MSKTVEQLDSRSWKVTEDFGSYTSVYVVYDEDPNKTDTRRSFERMSTEELSAVKSLIGAAGPQGTTGGTGAQGIQGRQGIAGTNGSNGAQGATGSTGGTGGTGAQGAAGVGTKGAQGAAGANGSNGGTGAQGATGATGPAGSNGSNGGTGAQGATGATGPTGPAGRDGSNGGTGLQGVQGPSGSGGGGGGYGIFAQVVPPAGNYILPMITTGGGMTNVTTTANRLTLYPMSFANNFTVASFNINVNIAATAGSLARICIYSDRSGTPADLLYQSANLDGSRTGIKEAVTDFVFDVGVVYWVGVHANAAINIPHVPTSDTLPFIAAVTQPYNQWYQSVSFSTSSPSRFSPTSYNIGNIPSVAIKIG